MTYVSRPLYLGQFDVWASAPNAPAVSGDFNGDGRADIALAGGQGWTTHSDSLPSFFVGVWIAPTGRQWIFDTLCRYAAAVGKTLVMTLG